MLIRKTFAKSKLLSLLHSLNQREARNRLRKAVRYPVLSSGSSAHSHAIDKLTCKIVSSLSWINFSSHIMLNLRKHSSVSLWWILAASLNHISFQVHLSFPPSLKTKYLMVQDGTIAGY